MLRPAFLMILVASFAGSCTTAPDDRMKTPQSVCVPAASDTEAARRAFFFAFPIYEMARTRQQMLSLPGAQVNAMLHRKTLSGPGDRSITTPNTDTLYSTAWLDLATGPVRFVIPAMGQRYHSVELMHAFSDAFAILRNETEKERKFLIVGPDWAGVAGVNETLIRSPTRDAWLVVRTFVNGPDDLAEAQRLQADYALEGETRRDPDRPTAIPKQPTAAQFLAVADAAMARGPLPPEHAGRIGCLASAGAGAVSSGASLLAMIAPGARRALARNFSGHLEEARLAFEDSGTLRDGWRYPLPHIARFGPDDVYRSAMALGGLAALPIDEAINPLASRDAEAIPFDGASSYRLRIPGNVPVAAFWSLTLYASDGEGRWFLYDNPINRHAISSLSGDMARDEDGAIVVQISHAKPLNDNNWLPAPQSGFLLVFRAYRPKSALIEGSFLLPPVTRMEP